MTVKQSISLNHYVTQKPGNIVSDMDGEKVMLSVENGKYYNLGLMGGEIWDFMNEPILIGEVINGLLAQYDVEDSVCQEQVLSFLEMLRKEELIELTETQA
ncbi:lasso peptide biosynthesis PqqD family chaperone [Alteribacter populi]|uniref:lasso peptide biosynthesis PqqD family chaperone n=1 Tax=Alteribacter populi TaxID=2011011 RepID=UPI000BBB12B2|nr:lasso peptide biosynthesis PqqD family chaperone [Alteribacter populi]